MPHKVTLYVDAIPVAEQEIPSDYIDTSYDKFHVRLDLTENAVKADFPTPLVVIVEKV